MPSRFLIEVEHDGERRACTAAVKVFLRTGSHFLTHADWGCHDGEHKAWIIVEVETKDEARNIVPAEFRKIAKVVQLNRFTMQEMEGKRDHPAK
jgi:hypothetical protein